MKTFKISLLIFFCSILSQCGYWHNPRFTKAYAENAIPDSLTVNLVIWPIHLGAFAVCGVIDQSIHSIEIIPDAGIDAADYFFLRVNGRNIMLERTIAVPKTLATPLIFVLSYTTRWIYPMSSDTRPFEQK